MLVNLITNSRFLEDRILDEYPYPIPANKHHACKTQDGTRIIHFKELELNQIIPYLYSKEEELSLKDCYDLRDSLGNCLMLRMKGLIMTDKREIDFFLKWHRLPSPLYFD